jgi:hypothetical protein
MAARLAIALLAFCSSAALAQDDSAALPPLGAAFSGAFNLGGRSIPLPEGEFVVTSARIDDARLGEGDVSKPRARLARAFLVQIQPPKVRAAVWATVALKPPSYRFEWVTRACQKENTLFRADLSAGTGSDSENCLLVDHRVANFVAKSEGMWQEARGWLREQQNIQLPVPVLIVASVTRMERWQLVSASYGFNPEAYGCDERRYRPWAESPWHISRIAADPEKVRFVESVTAWGRQMQEQFNQLVTGGQPTAHGTSRIHQCAGGGAPRV